MYSFHRSNRVNGSTVCSLCRIFHEDKMCNMYTCHSLYHITYSYCLSSCKSGKVYFIGFFFYFTDKRWRNALPGPLSALHRTPRVSERFGSR